MEISTSKLLQGTFKMGADSADCSQEDAVSPAFEVSVEPFKLGIYSVSNDQFATFVEATGYKTTAEELGSSLVFYDQLPSELLTRAVKEMPWWRQVEGACWSAPSGPKSNIAHCSDHPVVHVSWQDACNFCDWVGGRLPTEAEWEFAARGGEIGLDYSWGNTLVPDGKFQNNVWQGKFPERVNAGRELNSTVPIDTFGPNQFGIWNMTGNVWEWCSNDFIPYVSFKYVNDFSGQHMKAIRGGSWLCHESYCARYRVWSRTGSPSDATSQHMGLRVAFDP
jgi:formylglycine-generating enzyme required for sulfatase activity